MYTAASQLALLAIFVAHPNSDTRVDDKVCGMNSLMLGAAYVNDIDPDQVRDLLDPERAPFSLQDLDQAARQLQLRTALWRWRDKRLARFDCPAILHIRASENSTECDHFIVCFGHNGEKLCVADYPRHPSLVSREWVLRFWDGDALYLDRANGTQIAALTRRNDTLAVHWVVVGIAGAVFIWLTSWKAAHRLTGSRDTGGPMPVTIVCP
jgi:ABC-type bacteriocin/lantibiotic exporter with double-glycine peptidase domain